jgi:hypothetical protein
MLVWTGRTSVRISPAVAAQVNGWRVGVPVGGVVADVVDQDVTRGFLASRRRAPAIVDQAAPR